MRGKAKKFWMAPKEVYRLHLEARAADPADEKDPLAFTGGSASGTVHRERSGRALTSHVR
jgi:hypothetical protein